MSICDPFLEGVACPKGGCAFIKRIIRLLTVTALLVLALAAPAFAIAGGIKPLNYGDCVSAVATGEGRPAANEAELEGEAVIPERTPQEYTALTAPLQSKGLGNIDDYETRCRNFPPG
jgi:hypothetical protein